MFRSLCALIPVHIEYALSLAGYIWVIVSLRQNLTSIPVVYPGLIVSTFTHIVRFFSPELYHIMYWLVFYVFVFQLITIHENDLCLLDQCKVTEVQKYIALASTVLMVIQSPPGKQAKKDKKTKPRKTTPEIVEIVQQTEKPGELNLRFESNNRNVKWV